MSEGDGPLFVEATTASGTGQYWGWRTTTLNREGEPLDPRSFGYPATDEFLGERALQPELWSATNADLGLYSTPSYRFDAEVVTATDRCVAIRIDSDLARPLTGAATLPLSGCAGARVENAEVVWRRVDGDAQDIRVAFDVPAGGTLEVTAGCTSREDGSPNR